LKCRAAGLRFRIVRREIDEQADPSHPLALLSSRGEGPRNCRTAKKTDEIAPSHVALATATLAGSWRALIFSADQGCPEESIS
jgi:hypothetical protein